MHPKILELKLDSSHVKANFDGYKLSLTSIPILKQDLEVAPFRAKASEDQYSFLHMQLFSMQNNLIQDPWDRRTSYFLAKDGNLMKVSYDESTGQPEKLRTIYKFNDLTWHKPGDYSVSFQFVSEKFCIFCNGCNEITLFNTGDRCKNAEWVLTYQSKVSADFNRFIIQNSRLDTVDATKIISIALQHIHNDGNAHLTQIFWGVLTEISKDQWAYELKNIAYGKGLLYYCAFEPRARSLIVSSNKEFTFKSKKFQCTDEEKYSTEMKDISLETGSYSWSQTDEDVTIKFSKKENRCKDDYKVTCTKNKILVKCSEEVIQDGVLFSSVDPNLTTWTLENDFLQISLSKENRTLVWPFLIENDGPKESFESDQKPTLIDENPIANLEAQIEECDFPTNTMGEDFIIERLNLEAERVTHKIILGNSAPLFSTSLRPGFPPALVTRQDVDASIWLQQYNPAKPDDWNLRHEGNLHAFGYVQASKQQKKFMDCAPNLSYSVICESHRHVFIYNSSYDTAGGLRNRNGPQVSVGKQNLVTLDDAGEVLGMSTSDNVITLLTEKCILYLQINSS